MAGVPTYALAHTLTGTQKKTKAGNQCQRRRRYIRDPGVYSAWVLGGS
jgi:hypothetical protein